MASAHIIEVGDRAAGIVVREHGGFRFFASERAFHPLEGALFRPSIRLSVRHASGSGPARCRAALLSPDWRRSDAQEASTSVAYARAGPPQ